jgi:hypothetical protein
MELFFYEKQFTDTAIIGKLAYFSMGDIIKSLTLFDYIENSYFLLTVQLFPGA